MFSSHGNRIRKAAGLILLLQLCACTTMPPIADTARDISHMRTATRSVRARFLSDSDIPALARLRQLRYLDFEGGCAVGEAALTDIGLDRLSKLDLPQLELLCLGYCQNITDSGLVHVGQMNTVGDLNLMGCPRITDAGLPPLLKMKNLKVLDLRGCPGITDRGLEYLIQKTDWQGISFGGCPNVTNEAVAKLQSALPNACIAKDELEWSYHKDDLGTR